MTERQNSINPTRKKIFFPFRKILHPSDVADPLSSSRCGPLSYAHLHHSPPCLVAISLSGKHPLSSALIFPFQPSTPPPTPAPYPDVNSKGSGTLPVCLSVLFLLSPHRTDMLSEYVWCRRLPELERPVPVVQEPTPPLKPREREGL